MKPTGERLATEGAFRVSISSRLSTSRRLLEPALPSAAEFLGVLFVVLADRLKLEVLDPIVGLVVVTVVNVLVGSQFPAKVAFHHQPVLVLVQESSADTNPNQHVAAPVRDSSCCSAPLGVIHA